MEIKVCDLNFLEAHSVTDIAKREPIIILVMSSMMIPPLIILDYRARGKLYEDQRIPLSEEDRKKNPIGGCDTDGASIGVERCVGWLPTLTLAV